MAAGMTIAKQASKQASVAEICPFVKTLFIAHNNKRIDPACPLALRG